MSQDSDKPSDRPGTAAQVDYLVGEDGVPLDTPDNSTVRATSDPERAVASTGPSNWWRTGLLLLALVVVVMGLLQILGAPSTDVQPGTPSSAPVTEQVAPK